MRYLRFPLLLPGLLLMTLYGCSHTETDFYDDGTLKSEITYKGGKKNGTAKWFYQNGVLQMECHYSNDTLEGTGTQYFLNGNRSREDHYLHNRKNGTSRIYDENGKISRVENYRNDTLHGPYQEYFNNGQVNVEGRFFLGLYDSIWNYYDEKGIPVGKGDFIKGKGKLSGYYWNGKLKREVNYLDNIKNGRETWYSGKGEVIRDVIYEKGKIVSVIKGDTGTTGNREFNYE